MKQMKWSNLDLRDLFDKKMVVVGKMCIRDRYYRDRTRDDNTDSADRSDLPNLSNVYGERF